MNRYNATQNRDEREEAIAAEFVAPKEPVVPPRPKPGPSTKIATVGKTCGSGSVKTSRVTPGCKGNQTGNSTQGSRGLSGIEPVNYFPVGETAVQLLESGAVLEDDWRPLDASFAGGPEAHELTSAALMHALATPDDEQEKAGDGFRGLSQVFGGLSLISKRFAELVEGGRKRRAARRAARRARRGLESGGPSGGNVLEVVNGRDDRIEIPDTTHGPWSGIVQLNILGGNGRQYVGTGWLIAPRTILTAGHCVYMHDAGGWAREITAAAGRNDDVYPFGKRVSSHFNAPSGWVDSANRSEDYGVIFLDETFSPVAGELPFNFPFASADQEDLKRHVLNLSGYPAGDPANGKDSTLQWFHARTPHSVTANTIVYDTDTGGGQSGSPCWHYDSSTGERVVVGIHTNGFPYANSATRISIEMEGLFEEWRAEGM